MNLPKGDTPSLSPVPLNPTSQWEEVPFHDWRAWRRLSVLSSAPVACPESVAISSAMETLSLQEAGDKDSCGGVLASMWDSRTKATSFTCFISEL